MVIQLQKLQCWDPGSGYNVFLNESAPIDLTALKGGAKYVQCGPYRVKIEVEGHDDKVTSLKFGSAGGVIKNIASSDSVSGSVFVFLDNIEKVSTDGKFTLLGSASGCFEIHW